MGSLNLSRFSSSPTNHGSGRSPLGFEFLDHTADVQLHSWGTNLNEAFEQVAVAMFDFMTDLDVVEERCTHQITASGHDLESLLYSFLDEWLYNFLTEPFFVPFKINILSFQRPEGNAAGEGDEDLFEIKAIGFGETYDSQRHIQGHEVKAITYASMQIIENEDHCDAFVIVDI